MDSASSFSVITGRVIFLTMTALPESDAHTSFDLKAFFPSNTRRMASATETASMIAPSTIASGGTGSAPNAVTLYPLPAGFTSTALTALDPMSSPTIVLAFAKSAISSQGVTAELRNRCAVDPPARSCRASRALTCSRVTNLQTVADSCEGDLPKRAVVSGYRSFPRPHHVNFWHIDAGTAFPFSRIRGTRTELKMHTDEERKVDTLSKRPYDWGLRLVAAA